MRICRGAYDVGNLLLIIDEVDKFCDPDWISPEFERLIKYGLHAKRAGRIAPVDFLVISRAPAEIHKSLIFNAFEICCFAISEFNALKYLKPTLGAEFVAGLETLPHPVFRRQDRQDRRTPYEELWLDLKTRALVHRGKEESPPP